MPGWRVALPQGDHVWVAQQGAQVLSWVTGRRERLFLSPGTTSDGHTPIRGGVPVCWPQFNQRGSLPKHGFARHLAWQRGSFEGRSAGAELRLRLVDSEQTLALWPQRFELSLSVCLSPGRLRVTLEVDNPGATDWAFSGALHSYLAVDDVVRARLHGLGGQAEWDSLRDVSGTGRPEVVVAGAFDRVYAAAPQPLRLIDGAHELSVSQSTSWANTVVWNPGAALPDLPHAAHRQMLCVEAAQVWAPVVVAAGQRWSGWQQFDVLAG